MKYIIIPFIALGLVLSLAIGIEYNCEGQEMFLPIMEAHLYLSKNH